MVLPNFRTAGAWIVFYLVHSVIHFFNNIASRQITTQWILFNPLSPNIHIQILQTDLHTFPYRMCKENLIKDQSVFPLVIILLIYSHNLTSLQCMDIVRRKLILVTFGT